MKVSKYILKRHVLALGLSACVFSQGISADTKTIKIANWLPPVHHMTATLKA
jgi:hypothetical protein